MVVLMVVCSSMCIHTHENTTLYLILARFINDVYIIIGNIASY